MSPYKDITQLLTVFPTLVHFLPLTHLLCNWKFVPLNSSPVSFLPTPSSNHLFVLCIYNSVSASCLFICFVFQIPSYSICLSLSDLNSLSIIPSTSIHTVTQEVPFYSYFAENFYQKGMLVLSNAFSVSVETSFGFYFLVCQCDQLH